MIWIAEIVVWAAGLWLIGLAVAIFTAPEPTGAFLTRFASSARAHYTEQALRLIAGVAFVLFAPQMKFPEVFRVFGWVLTVTASALILMPWRWHRRYAEWTVPPLLRHIKWLAIGALGIGAFVLYSAR